MSIADDIKAIIKDNTVYYEEKCNMYMSKRNKYMSKCNMSIYAFGGAFGAYTGLSEHLKAVNIINYTLMVKCAIVIGGYLVSLANICIVKSNINLFYKNHQLDVKMRNYIGTSDKTGYLSLKYNSYIKRTKIHSVSDSVTKIFGISSLYALYLRNDVFASIYGMISIGAFIVREMCNLKKYKRKLLKALD